MRPSSPVDKTATDQVSRAAIKPRMAKSIPVFYGDLLKAYGSTPPGCEPVALELILCIDWVDARA